MAIAISRVWLTGCGLWASLTCEVALLPGTNAAPQPQTAAVLCLAAKHCQAHERGVAAGVALASSACAKASSGSRTWGSW